MDMSFNVSVNNSENSIISSCDLNNDGYDEIVILEKKANNSPLHILWGNKKWGVVSDPDYRGKEETIHYSNFSTAPQIYGTANGGHSTRLEYIIKLDTAKEMAMLERNEKGKQVRKYFIAVEEKYKQGIVDRQQLSPQMQMLMGMVEAQAKQELEQKRLAREVEKVKQAQNAIVDTFQKADEAEDFQQWANDRIAQIAESPKFDRGFGRSKNYSLARTESYERLKQKRNCRLDDRVQKAIGRALEERPDIKKSELQKINKIYIIANDKDLRPAYELVIKEMMIHYCVS